MKWFSLGWVFFFNSCNAIMLFREKKNEVLDNSSSAAMYAGNLITKSRFQMQVSTEKSIKKLKHSDKPNDMLFFYLKSKVERPQKLGHPYILYAKKGIKSRNVGPSFKTFQEGLYFDG